MPLWEKIAAVVIGVTFLITLLVLAVLVRNPTPFQIYVFRVVLSLAGGAFAALITGFIEITLPLLQRGMVRAGGGLAVFLLLYLSNPPALIHPPASPGVQIHDTVQFRVWKGYRDDMGREISRNDRFEGPVGVILTPIVSNETTPAQSLFVKKIELEISFDGRRMSFTPKYLTNIHPERAENEWLSIVDDFVGFSVSSGDSWREDLAFKGDDLTSYVDFLKSVLTFATDQETLDLHLIVSFGDKPAISAKCQVSATEFKEDIVDAIKVFDDFPSYSQLKCSHQEVNQ